MSRKIKVKWQASDGYVGGSRPQSFKVDPEDYKGMTASEIRDAIYEVAQEDFEQKVSWELDDQQGVILEIMKANGEDAK